MKNVPIIFSLLSLYFNASLSYEYEQSQEDCNHWDQNVIEGCECDVRPKCNSACCDPKTCKLFENATCAGGMCCNLATCQFKVVPTICRFSKNECDLPEYCNGISEQCPEDVYVANFETCGSIWAQDSKSSKKSYCINAVCQNFTRVTPLTPSGLTCPKNCSGSGVCNNLGHSHCDVGFGGEDCLESGPGGSIDSGPLTVSNFILASFTRFSYIVFCAAIPFVVLLNFYICIFCQSVSFRKPQKYRSSNVTKHRESQAAILNNKII